MNQLAFTDIKKSPVADAPNHTHSSLVLDNKALNKTLWAHIYQRLQEDIEPVEFLSFLQQEFSNCGRRTISTNDPQDPMGFIEEILLEQRQLHGLICKGYFLYLHSLPHYQASLWINERDILSEHLAIPVA